MARKLIKYIFICFGLIFLMSQNTFAYEAVPANSRITGYWRGSQIKFKPDNTGSWITNNSFYTFTDNPNNPHGVGFSSISFYNASMPNVLKSGRYVVIEGQGMFYSWYQTELNASGFLGISDIDTNCAIVDLDYEPFEAPNPDSTYTNSYIVPFTLVCRLTADADYALTNLEAHAWRRTDGQFSEVSLYYSAISVWEVTATTSDINNTLNSILAWLQNNADDAGDVLSQEKQDVQDASNDSAQDGSASETAVNNTTQSLSSALTSISGALINAPATNCKISVNTTGNSASFTSAIGQLDLCSRVPQNILNTVQTIIALVFTPIVLYFAYNVITTIYGLFKEYNS